MFEAQEAGMRKLGLYIKSQISGGGKESYFRCFQVCNVEVRQNSLLKPTDLCSCIYIRYQPIIHR